MDYIIAGIASFAIFVYLIYTLPANQAATARERANHPLSRG
jgi:hypothetical protein